MLEKLSKIDNFFLLIWLCVLYYILMLDKWLIMLLECCSKLGENLCF